MDRRIWPWRKQASEKSIAKGRESCSDRLASDSSPLSTSSHPLPTKFQISVGEVEGYDCMSTRMDNQMQQLKGKVETLTSQLSSAIADGKAKDELVLQHSKVAEEAVSGWEKAGAEVLSLKKLLEESNQQKKDAEDHTSCLNEALKECTRQIKDLKLEYNKRIYEAVLMKEKELATINSELKEKIARVNHQLKDAQTENALFHKSVKEKSRTIEEMNEKVCSADGHVKMLQVRLNSLQKENKTFRYELRVLNKELDICNQEREHLKRSAEVAHKQYIESLKKVASLEKECQRLQILVRKRSVLPAAEGQIKNDVVTMRKCMTSGQRNKQAKGTTVSSLEVESLLNTVLKQSIFDDIESSRGDTNRLSERSITSMLEDGGNDDKVSCAESWASALISELALLKRDDKVVTPRHSVNTLEFGLMDDFVEMERLAALSADKNSYTSLLSTSVSETTPVLVEEGSGAPQLATNSDIRNYTVNGMTVKGQNVEKWPSCAALTNRMTKSENPLFQTDLHDVNRGTMDSKKHTGSSSSSNCAFTTSVADTMSPYSTSRTSTSEEESTEISSITERKCAHGPSQLEKSVQKILNIIENFAHSDDKNQRSLNKTSEISSLSCILDNSSDFQDYLVRVLLWRSSEFCSVTRSLANACFDFLHKKADTVSLVEVLASILDLFVSHLITLQDVSMIKEQFNWKDESKTVENIYCLEDKKEIDIQVCKSEHDERENSPSSPDDVSSHLTEAQDQLTEKEVALCKVNGENVRLKNEFSWIRLEKEDLEERIQQAAIDIETVQFQLQESEENVSKLQYDLAIAKERLETLENSLANEQSLNEKLSSRNKVLNTEVIASQEKLALLQTSFEEQQKYSLVLKGRCVEFQKMLERCSAQRNTSEPKSTSTLQESKASEHESGDDLRSEKKQDCEDAVDTLAQCQETISAVGKQLKELAPKQVKDLQEKFHVPNRFPSPLAQNNAPSTMHSHCTFSDLTKADKEVQGTSSPSYVDTKPEVVCLKDEKDRSKEDASMARDQSTGLIYGATSPLNCQRKRSFRRDKCNDESVRPYTPISSPAKSPMRFLNMKTKSSVANTGHLSTVEEIGSKTPGRLTYSGSGFRKLFSRTKNNH